MFIWGWELETDFSHSQGVTHSFLYLPVNQYILTNLKKEVPVKRNWKKSKSSRVMRISKPISDTVILGR